MRANRRQFIRSAGAWIAIAISPRALGATATIAGRVVDASTGLGVPGIAVSAGEAIVATDSAGSFNLELVADLTHVFVTTPAGWAAAGPHYATVGSGSRAEIRLRRVEARRRDRLRVAHVSDLHIGVQERPHYVSPEQLVEDLAAVVKQSSPDLIVATGDLVDQGRPADLEACQRAFETIGVPVIPLFAAHDALQEWRTTAADAVAGRAFRDVFGPQWYSFDWGRWHFVLFPELNATAQVDPPRQLLDRWVINDLSRLPADRLVAVVTHDPPRFCSDGVAYFSGPRVDQIAIHPGLRLVLHGQYHSSRTVAKGNVVVVGTTSLGMGGIDTSPRGYTVIDLEADGVNRVECRPIAAVSRPARPAADRPASLRVSWQRDVGHALHRARPALARKMLLINGSDWPDPRHHRILGLNAANGAVEWELPTDAVVKNSVAVSADGAEAYAVSVSGGVYAFDPATGRVKWNVDLPNHPDRWIYSVPIVTDRLVIVAQYSGTVALDRETGRERWRDGPQSEDGWSPVYQRPVTSGDLYYLLTTKSLSHYAIAARYLSTGEVVWMRRLDRSRASHLPSLYQNAFVSPLVAGVRLLVSGLGDRLLALDSATGDTFWDEPVLFHEGPWIGVRPATYISTIEQATGWTTSGGAIYVSTGNGFVYAVDLTTGRRLWQFDARRPPLLDMLPYARGGANMLGDPALVGDRLFVGGCDGTLLVLDPARGTLIEAHQLGAPITAQPLPTPAGLVVATFDGVIRCLSTASPSARIQDDL